MAYSETRIVIGGLAHVPVLIFIANFIKGIFGIKTEEIKDTVIKEEPVKIIELKNTEVKEGKAFGRSTQNKSVHFEGSSSLVGKTVDVYVEQAFPQTLRGRLVQ